MKLTCQNCGKEFSWYQRSTIKPKFCPNCTYRFAVSDSVGKKDISVVKNKSGLKRKKTAKQKARDNADLWFSRFIRCKYNFQILNDGTLLCKCIITGTIKEAKKMDNGHCFSRKFLLTRYEEDNCRPQNRSSNRFSGEADHYKFRDNLLEEIREERFNRLDKLRKQEGPDTEQFYQEQANKYRKLTNQLIKQYNIKKWWQ